MEIPHRVSGKHQKSQVTDDVQNATHFEEEEQINACPLRLRIPEIRDWPTFHRPSNRLRQHEENHIRYQEDGTCSRHARGEDFVEQD